MSQEKMKPVNSKLYDVLGVPTNASQEDIKSAFKLLAKQYHPDTKTGDEDRFREVSEAYNVLSSPDEKEYYDKFGITRSAGPKSLDDSRITQGAVIMLEKILDAALSSLGNDIFTTNIVHNMGSLLANRENEILAAVDKSKKESKFLEKVHGRFNNKDEANNPIFENSLRLKIATEELARVNFNAELLIIKRTKELLKNYEFEQDKAPDVTRTSFSGFRGFGSGGSQW